MDTEDFFSRPALIDAAIVGLDDELLAVRAGTRSVRFKGLPARHVPTVRRWLEEGRRNLAAAGREDVPFRVNVLRALDAAWLLEEGSDAQGLPARSGVAVLSRVEQAYRARLENGPPLPATSDSPEARARQLLGNAVEYYHVTLAAYDAVAPCLARLPGPLRTIMAAFVLEEYRHDRILLRAAECFGLEERELVELVPLPYTAAVTNYLAFLGNTDPLSLLATLFILEGRPSDGLPYFGWLEQMGAPAAYVESHKEHDRVNTNGRHGTISRQCFAQIERIEVADEARILACVLQLARFNQLRQHELVRYHDDPAMPCPRTVAALKACLDRTPASAVAGPVGSAAMADGLVAP